VELKEQPAYQFSGTARNGDEMPCEWSPDGSTFWKIFPFSCMRQHTLIKTSINPDQNNIYSISCTTTSVHDSIQMNVYVKDTHMSFHTFRLFRTADLSIFGSLAASAQEPLTLRQAIDLALVQNPEVAVAQTDEKGAASNC
jgi:hypothetical protein